MFIGHYAPALVAATSRRAPSLWVLFVAAQLADIAFFLLTLGGVEHYAVEPLHTAMSPLWFYDVPWSHSLLGTLGWAAGFGVAVRMAGGGKDAAWLGAAVVAAHWFLDVPVHAADLTLAGGARRYGFGLWNHPYVAMPIELGLAFLALTYYANHSRAVGRPGTATLIVLAVAMTGFQLAEWLAPRAPEAADPAPAGIAVAALAAYTILTVLAGWTGATRRACPARPALAPSPRRGTGDGR